MGERHLRGIAAGDVTALCKACLAAPWSARVRQWQSGWKAGAGGGRILASAPRCALPPRECLTAARRQWRGWGAPRCPQFHTAHKFQVVGDCAELRDCNQQQNECKHRSELGSGSEVLLEPNIRTLFFVRVPSCNPGGAAPHARCRRMYRPAGHRAGPARLEPGAGLALLPPGEGRLAVRFAPSQKYSNIYMYTICQYFSRALFASDPWVCRLP